VAAWCWLGWVAVQNAARGRQRIPECANAGLGTCLGIATCVHDPARCEPPDGRPGCSSTPGYESISWAVHGTPAGRIQESKKNLCCVTTRCCNFRSLGCLGRRGLRTPRTFHCGMLGFGSIVQTPFGLSPCCLPAAHLPKAFGVLAVALVPASWLVLAFAAFAQTDPRPRSPWTGMAAVAGINMMATHGRSLSQGIARGERVLVLLGRWSKPRTRYGSQLILRRMNQTREN
jgi:hypothetical protein